MRIRPGLRADAMILSVEPAALVQQPVLDIPELLRQIDVIGVRVVKPLDLVPECVDLRLAVGLDLVQLRQLVDQLAVFEDRLQQLPNGVVLQGLDLPGGIGIKDIVRLGEIDLLVPQAQLIRQRLSAVLIIVAVDALEAGVGNLLGVLGELNLRDKLACLFILYGCKLVYTAECRAVLCGDEVGADTP